MNIKILKFVAILLFPIILLFYNSCKTGEVERIIGINLWSVRDAMSADPAGTLAELGEMGFGFVEAAGYSDGMFYGMQPSEFRNLVEENGMVFLSSHVGRNLPAPEQWNETLQWWRNCIEAHAQAGVKYIVKPWLGLGGPPTLERLDAFSRYLNTIGEMASAKGIRFGFHNHAEEFNLVEGNVIFDYLLKNTNPEKVFFQIDLFWAFIGNADPVDYFTRFPGRFPLWHTKDRAELGASGEIDFVRIYEHAELAGLQYSIIEHESFTYEPLESVRISLDYLKNNIYQRLDRIYQR
ncbi:MAG TPA: sugar phosphate isomerase/epimerase [Bacteroidales bacterium]|nr:sugar phosphate isomerase/epimerase [Bacteroidales bacterium]